ncbi:allantoinase AllB [Pelagovum pacificum]|nr:allantoinase AllB [Pelagovum pacificum]
MVTEDADFLGGVVVAGGVVTEVVEGTPDRPGDVVEVGGRVLLSGLVDPHVHFSEPGRDWEGWLTGSRSAAAGGITSVAEMPLNAIPPTTDVSALRLKLESARTSVVDYTLWGGVVPGNEHEIGPLAREGVTGFKAFMCRGSDEFPHVSIDDLHIGARRIRQAGSFLAVHAEDEALTSRLTRTLIADGRRDPKAWGEARPVEAEVRAIASAIALAAGVGCRLHIVHVSTAEGIDLVTAAREARQDVTNETCPHYLFFTEDDLHTVGPFAKCAPPLRSAEIREELWARVLSGDVDIIASDHSPCPLADKEAGTDDIFKAWGGISGIQSGLNAILTEGVHRRGLPLSAVARMMSANPARLLGQYPRKGTIAPGSDADLVIVDLDKAFTLKASDLAYRHPHSAYAGQTFRGTVDATFLRGKMIHGEGLGAAPVGGGRFLNAVADVPATALTD